jgi:hypothetical protein
MWFICHRYLLPADRDLPLDCRPWSGAQAHASMSYIGQRSTPFRQSGRSTLAEMGPTKTMRATGRGEALGFKERHWAKRASCGATCSEISRLSRAKNRPGKRPMGSPANRKGKRQDRARGCCPLLLGDVESRAEAEAALATLSGKAQAAGTVIRGGHAPNVPSQQPS